MQRRLTKAEEKSLLVFKKVVETKEFKDAVASIRKKLKIPEDGFIFQKNITKIKEEERDEHEYTAKGFRWEVKSLYKREDERLLDMFPVRNNYFSMLIRNYVFYGIFLYEELERFRDPTSNMCLLMEANIEGGLFLLPDKDPETGSAFVDQEIHNRRVEELIYTHPVSIRIQSSVSQNTLIDFIKKNWHTIECYQNEYKKSDNFNFKHSRTSINEDKKARNNFIFKHKDLPRKEIVRLVGEKFGEHIDVGLVGKVISLRNKGSKGE